MRYMNRYDIHDAGFRYRDHPTLGAATRTLANLMDWADENSDGWAHWRKPASAAARLMELIERDGTALYARYERPDVTVEEYRKALRPIKSFRTRLGADFEIEEV